MFLNSTGHLRVDAEALMERAMKFPRSEDKNLSAMKTKLRGVLNSFEESVTGLPESRKNALLVLLYTEIMEKIFDFHVSAEATLIRQRIVNTKSEEEQLTMLHQFEERMQSLLKMYRD